MRKPSVSTDNAIEELRKRFNPDAARNVSATYLLSIQSSNGDGTASWITKIADGKCEFIRHDDGNLSCEPDCRISVSAEDLEMIMTGRMTAMTAALSGMLAIEGELGLAMQLVPIFFEGQAPFI